MPVNPGRSDTPTQTALRATKRFSEAKERDSRNVCAEPGAGGSQKVKAANASGGGAIGADHSTPVSRAPPTPRSGSARESPRAKELKKLRKEADANRNDVLKLRRQLQDLQEGHQVSEAEKQAAIEKKAGAIAALARQLQAAKDTLAELMSMTDAEALDNVTAAAGEVPAANLFNQVWGLGFSSSPP